MAKTDSTVEQHPSAEFNPLSRYFLTEGTLVGPHEESLATLTGMLTGVLTLVRILATSESFRELRDTNQYQEPEEMPFTPMTTEGLFMALHFLTERAEAVAGHLLTKQEKQKS
ncbi:hypothetical protein [Dyella tabacisoli]|uniref:Uncharacterized protein n=1 Tax=Dyella tabacisoli TaxID=2282381 RepID=A0A369ULK1_9GAMM|nr:hypothetical protein [Dyella tabacisoli]RDD81411.1 hypothetical protein DVJ77_11905 [Dyella tabacisoli]